MTSLSAGDQVALLRPCLMLLFDHFLPVSALKTQPLLMKLKPTFERINCKSVERLVVKLAKHA